MAGEGGGVGGKLGALGPWRGWAAGAPGPEGAEHSRGRVGGVSHGCLLPPRCLALTLLSLPLSLCFPLYYIFFLPSSIGVFFFLFNNRLYQNQNPGPKGGGRGVTEDSA